MKRAVILVSGGLDSATVLWQAKALGFSCFALSFDYGQRHRLELEAATKVVESAGADEHRILKLDIGAFGGSALTDISIPVPEEEQDGIPVTYVPARNTIFLSMALAWSEVIGAKDIFIGVNAVDYSGYPDCRPEFVSSFEKLANIATKTSMESDDLIRIHTPLIDLGKSEIIQLGTKLGVNYSLTISCYQPDVDGKSCGKCDSCRIRSKGFYDLGIPDPTIYV
ncbi:MAG: 7-cyano-7-deazaguanine synthase QueC [Gammaproteobacteria bacterium]|nr:7-cyano-7-deazaguanine synthase QueC [Gammaproteobacteria bacterium]|tara:strand:+ start:97 stop:768 length:672 start_codon:yes stop_codon:yes gene_type:complete